MTVEVSQHEDQREPKKPTRVLNKLTNSTSKVDKSIQSKMKRLLLLGSSHFSEKEIPPFKMTAT